MTDDQETQTKKLYLSTDDKRLSGLCAGIAEYFDIDPSVVRLAWILLTILSGILPGIVAYIIAAQLIPKRPVNDKDNVFD